MRLAVHEQGYASAVEALVSGNELAAQTATRLAGRLRTYAGMAGDDSTATDFASSYDEAATASIAALESTVGAFGVLGRMVEASLTNHARADARSTLPGWARAVVGPPTVADRTVGVRLAPPPSSLGADDGGPGGPAGMVLDLLADVFWPNADTDRVRAAGAAWTVAGEAVGLLEAHCGSALAALDGERSPEIPVALTVVGDVRDRVVDLAAQLGALGAACYEYADHVDTKRSELRSLLEDLAQELALGAILAGGLSVLSGGAAAGIAGGAGAARLASASSRARGILDSLRVLTAGPALTGRETAVVAGDVALTTERINGARVLMTEGVPATSRIDRTSGPFARGFLNLHENTVAHTIRDHVARTLPQLRQRFLGKPRLTHASTFRTQDEAEEAIARAFRLNEDRIQDWLVHGKTSKGFNADLGGDVGDVLIKESGELVSTSRLRIVLIHDETMASGWRLLTAYPTL